MARKIDKRNSVKVVMQNDFIKAKVSRDMDANSHKFLRIAMAQCKLKDDEFYEYEVTAPELADMFGVSLSNIYHHVDKWTSQCMGTVLEFRREDEAIKKNRLSFRKYALFSMCEYQGGVLKMKLNPDMTPFILGIKEKLGFTQYELTNVLTVKGKYTIRIFEMCLLEMKSRQPFAQNVVEFDLPLDELRRQTSTENCYKQIGEFKKRVWSKALMEIEKAMNWKIESSDIKKGRTVVGFHLRIWSQVGFEYTSALQRTFTSTEDFDDYVSEYKSE